MVSRTLMALCSLAVSSTVLAAEPPRPKLVFFLVIDQFRADFITRFDDFFTDGGFKRLCREGAWYDNAYYEYGETATGPGHATLLTGTLPSGHGIVGNDWYQRDDPRKELYCCSDAREQGLGYPEGERDRGYSPRRLAAATLGDQFKGHSGGRSKVWGLSIKERAAVLSAGKNADGAVWWSDENGNLVTSTYYGRQLPGWAKQFNESRWVDRFVGKTWELLLPQAAYAVRPIEGQLNAEAYRKFHPGDFPKALGDGPPNEQYYDKMYATPYGNDLLFEAAKRLIDAEHLGADDDTDLLVLSLSSNDEVGHLYGPDSVEVMDCTLRTDLQIASFLNWLEGKVGLDHCLVALSSDHGAGPITEYTAALGLGGDRYDKKGLIKAVEQRLADRYGKPKGDHGYVVDLLLPWLYLDPEALRQSSADPDDAARLAAQVARENEGTAEAFAAPDIAGEHFAGSSDLRRQVANSYFPGRSGQVYIHWKRYWYKGKKVAGHGAAYGYDQHVPVILRGPGVRPGRYARRICPTELTITICRLLGLEPPKGASGAVLTEALGENGR